MVKLFMVLSAFALTACSISSIKGVPLNDGTYKFISGGESKKEAFMMSVVVMRNTCGYDGVQYEIVDQLVESEGEVITREKSHTAQTLSIGNIFGTSKSEIENESFRGYDITTIFKCLNQKT